MTPAELADFVRVSRLAVLATKAPDGSVQAALVGVAMSDDGEIVFDTLATSRKFRNMLHEPQVALVVGWAGEVTVQCEGAADVLSGVDLERCRGVYFASFPDGRDRAADPDIRYVRVRPRWVRRSDFSTAPARIDEERFTVDFPNGK